MRKFLVFCMAAFVVACGPTKPCPKCPEPDCPPAATCPDCPAPTPCPTPEPCPACPDCPPCDPNVVCPQPPAPPVYEDVSHAATEFELMTVLGAPQTLGMYVADPNGQYNAVVFVMPEMHQRTDFEQVLFLSSDADSDNDTAFGTTEGRQNDDGLVVTTVCEREFADVCTANVVTNGPDIARLEVTMTGETPTTYVWRSK